MKSLQELYPGDYESFKNANVDRVPGTCEWLLEHRLYTEWKESNESALLWISADAGCGKSTFAKFLVDHYRHTKSSNGSPVSICHFFFKEGITSQQSTVLAVRAVLHQIFTRDRALMRHYFPEYETKGSAMADELDTLVSVLLRTVNDPEAPSFIFILDALDECPNGDLERLLGALNKLYAPQNPLMSRSDQHLKVLMLSRPENSIKNTLRKQPMTIRLKGEDEIESISKDVSLMIQHAMKDLKVDGIPVSLLGDFSERLEAGADNTFLWVSLIIQILRDHTRSRGGASRNEILDLLKSRNIYSVYNHLLGKVANQPDTRKFLHVVLAATEPLTVRKMSVAMAVSEEHQTLDDISSDIRYPCEDYIQSLGGHFIRIIQSRIYLVHQTAREFLLDLQQQAQSKTEKDAWQHSITIEKSHEELLAICLSYLICAERSRLDMPPIVGESLALENDLLHSVTTSRRRLVLQRKLEVNFGQDPEPDISLSTEQISHFSGYAIQSWQFHFRVSKARQNEELLSRAAELCRLVPETSGYPTWTSAMKKLVGVAQSYWLDGNSRSQFSRQVRIVLRLGIREITTKIITPSSSAALEEGETLLHIAAALGSSQDFQWLFNHCHCDLELNKLDFRSETILNVVLEGRSVPVSESRKLIARGASVRAPGRQGRTPLHCLAKYGPATEDSAALVRLLVEKGAQVDAKDDDGITPLFLATEEGNAPVVEALLAYNPNINARGKDNKAVIHMAAERADAYLLTKILDKGADITVADMYGSTPLNIVRRQPTMEFSVVSRLVPETGQMKPPWRAEVSGLRNPVEDSSSLKESVTEISRGAGGGGDLGQTSRLLPEAGQMKPPQRAEASSGLKESGTKRFREPGGSGDFGQV